MTADEIKRFMIRWNNQFPCDYYWRKKHNIPFLSSSHREQSFLNQRMEFEEDRLFAEIEEKRDIGPSDKYVPNQGDIFKIRILKEEDTKRPIDAEDIDDFRREAEAIRKWEEEHGTGQDNKDNG